MGVFSQRIRKNQNLPLLMMNQMSEGCLQPVIYRIWRCIGWKITETPPPPPLAPKRHKPSPEVMPYRYQNSGSLVNLGMWRLRVILLVTFIIVEIFTIFLCQVKDESRQQSQSTAMWIWLVSGESTAAGFQWEAILGYISVASKLLNCCACQSKSLLITDSVMKLSPYISLLSMLLW